MNIVAPALTAIPLNTANFNTEAARRDNIARETVPQLSNTENSAAESGLGSESDRVKTPGQAPQPVTYEKPQANQQALAQGQNGQNKDNGEDPSAGKQDAKDQQQQSAEQKKVEELKQRDQEVRAHEQAHAATGGQHAGAPSYEFETGPDGKRYAVGGEVNIDISEEKSPQDTLRKMQQVRAAALAPAEPSPQDLRVAAEAQQKASQARQDIASQSADKADQAYQSAFSAEDAKPTTNIASAPELDEIVDGNVSPPTRKLQEDDPVAEAAGLESSSAEFKQSQASLDFDITARSLRIESFYQQISQPREYSLRHSA
ncbi:putative metalloprotease CJM1_0395 family protein [Bowmanella denitrificans]|nr:putative metalloprotease CJM1_0395 family protein [Bowmanella denitrificans]